MIEAIKAAPVASVGGLTLWGYHLNDVVLVMTAFYTLFLIIDKLPTMYCRIKQMVDFLRRRK